VIANGAGAGHGVGLCQTGALGMARGGATAEKILEHYYPHIELLRLY
jgi:stage II sporulation protein D